MQFFGYLSSFVSRKRTPYVLPQRIYSRFLQGIVNNLMQYERFHMLLCCSRQFTPIVYQGYFLPDTTVFKTLLK